MFIWLVVGIAILIGLAAIADKFLPPSPEPLWETDDFRTPLQESLQSQNILLKKIYVQGSYEAGPFQREHKYGRNLKLDIFILGITPLTQRIYKCILEKDGQDIECWCKVKTFFGQFDSVEWRMMN